MHAYRRDEAKASSNDMRTKQTKKKNPKNSLAFVRQSIVGPVEEAIVGQQQQHLQAYTPNCKKTRASRPSPPPSLSLRFARLRRSHLDGAQGSCPVSLSLSSYRRLVCGWRKYRYVNRGFSVQIWIPCANIQFLLLPAPTNNNNNSLRVVVDIRFLALI
jgi:hypothetical protein